jgi:hypothetical protein
MSITHTHRTGGKKSNTSALQSKDVYMHINILTIHILHMYIHTCIYSIHMHIHINIPTMCITHTHRTGGKKSNTAALQIAGSAHRKPRQLWLARIKKLYRILRAVWF